MFLSWHMKMSKHTWKQQLIGNEQPQPQLDQQRVQQNLKQKDELVERHVIRQETSALERTKRNYSISA
jgi:hypothetical protein